MDEKQPGLLVFSGLFPHSGAPGAGLFIRERMFRVGKKLKITVVSPRPWFPGQRLIRYFRPHFRLPAPGQEIQDGINVYFPRYLSVPGLFKNLDGLSMALCTYPLMRKLRKTRGFDVIDAHFGYPDGYAATLLGKRLGLPVTITLRGTEVPHSRKPRLRRHLVRALDRASALIAVSDSLKRHAVLLGIGPERIKVVGNGVDTEKFYPVDREITRYKLGIAKDTKVLVSVGALVERKGFHRVIEIIPDLLKTMPDLQYLIAGGAGPEGDLHIKLEQQIRSLNLENHVRLLGAVPPTELKSVLSAADLFVLATSNEGWANVFLEAMACGLPVVTTDVGGNREVVCRNDLGSVVPFGDAAALRQAISDGLRRDWNRDAILGYARDNSWDDRVENLERLFRAVAGKT